MHAGSDVIVCLPAGFASGPGDDRRAWKRPRGPFRRSGERSCVEESRLHKAGPRVVASPSGQRGRPERRLRGKLMRTYSMDLRERVTGAVDQGLLTKAAIARTFGVSTAWIRRLL